VAERLIVTCEHGGNEVPSEYAYLFEGRRDVLESHRGYDPGALELSREMAERFAAPLHFATTTRLLVELNRSAGHRRLFSEFAAGLDDAARGALIDRFYRPYRGAVESAIADEVSRAHRVLHLSVHTFTPVMDDVVRTADIGLLYDPARRLERAFCDAWRDALSELRRDLRVRRNYPYLGKSDGFTTYLRTRFDAALYAGIELEVNQKWPLGDRPAWANLMESILDAMERARSDRDSAVATAVNADSSG
jgi:predicted N-formylglutamate amidohydrolase